MDRRFLLTMAIGALSLGCGDGPLEPLQTEYVLESIAEVSLPAPFLVTQGTQVVILESTIEFTSPTRGEERTKQRLITTADPTGTVSDQTLPFSYTLDGDNVAITYDCPDLASCIAGPHLSGEIDGGKLVFDHSLGRAPLVYRPD